MYNRLQLDNFYVTELTADKTLTPWTDWVLPLLAVPNIADWKLFFVVVNVSDIANRFVLPVYMDWWYVKYKWYSVSTLTTLHKYDSIQINDVKELFDLLYSISDDFWIITVTDALEVMSYWWDISIWNVLYTVPDVTLTLIDNAINHIILDYSDHTLKSVTTLPAAYYKIAQITTSWGAITQNLWKRSFVLNDFFNDDFFERNLDWEIIIKDEAIKWTNIDFWSFDADDIFEWSTHLFLTPTERQDIEDNTTDRHTHANKTLLDTYNQLNANIADAITKRHTHTNKTTLDLIPDISTWNEWDVLKKVWATIMFMPESWWWSWSTASWVDVFVWDWVSSTFTLNHLPVSDNAIFMSNDSWQRYYQWVDYSRTWLVVTFFNLPEAWRYIYVQYFEQINISQIWETNTMVNLPWSWIWVYKQKAGVQFEMRRITGINWITVTQQWDEIRIDWMVMVWPWWEINTASNVWSWTWLYKAKNWVDLQFKTIQASDTIDVVEDPSWDEITIELKPWAIPFYRRWMF